MLKISNVAGIRMEALTKRYPLPELMPINLYWGEKKEKKNQQTHTYTPHSKSNEVFMEKGGGSTDLTSPVRI